jgi:hypothetical protein
MAEDNTFMGAVSLKIIILLTVMGFWILFCDGLIISSAFMPMHDQFIDPQTGTHYVNGHTFLSGNVTYKVDSEKVYNNLTSNGYPKIININRSTYTITDTLYCSSMVDIVINRCVLVSDDSKILPYLKD